MKNSLTIISALVIGSTALAGCGAAIHQAAPSHSPHATTVAAASTSQAKSSSKVYTPAPSPTEPADGTANSTKALVRVWAQHASNGQAVGSPWKDQQSYEDVTQSWGRKVTTGVTGINYASFPSHDAVIGFNDGMQIVDLRSDNPNLHQITRADIESVMGRPAAVRHTQDSQIYVYNRGQYQLLWVFSKSSSGQVSATVNHADVQWPKGFVAPMTQANPKP